MFTTGKVNGSGSNIAFFDSETGVTTLEQATFEQLQDARAVIERQLFKLEKLGALLP